MKWRQNFVTGLGYRHGGRFLGFRFGVGWRRYWVGTATRNHQQRQHQKLPRRYRPLRDKNETAETEPKYEDHLQNTIDADCARPNGVAFRLSVARRAVGISLGWHAARIESHRQTHSSFYRNRWQESADFRKPVMLRLMAHPRLTIRSE